VLKFQNKIFFVIRGIPNGKKGKRYACFTMIWVKKQKVYRWLFSA
jgi:hypothetical protein